jgi:hypothetical protein
MQHSQMWIRALAVAAGVLLAGVVPAGASANPAVAGRVFTVAGGGSLPPAPDRPATATRLTPTELTLQQDGSVLFVNNDRNLWGIGVDGRLWRPPPPGRKVTDVVAEPGGGLLAVADEKLLRLRPAAPSWEVLFTPPPPEPPARSAAVPDEVALLEDGRILLGGSYLSWILEPDGRMVETLDGGGDEGVAGLPDGTIVLLSNNGLIFRRPEDRLRGTGDRFLGTVLADLATTASGSLLLGDGEIYRLSRQLRRFPVYGYRPGYGIGDGAPFGRQLLSTAALVTTTNGVAAFAEYTAPLLRGRFAAEAVRRGRYWITNVYPYDERPGAGLIRVVASQDDRRPLLAIAPRTFRSLARGVIGYRSAVAGRGRLIVRRTRVVVDLPFTAVAGRGTIRLPRRLPPASYRITATIHDGTRSSIARAAVSTHRRLDRLRAMRRIRRIVADSGGGDATDGAFGRLGECRDRGPRRLDCGLWLDPYSEYDEPDPPFCEAILSARQRPEGVRVLSLRPLRDSQCRTPAR